MDYYPILFFLLLLVMVAICYLSYLKGKFNRFRKTHLLFAGLATSLPLVDTAQTFIALGYGAEGNPLLLYFLAEFAQDLGPTLFVAAHLTFCVLGLYTGWKGKNEPAVDYRTFSAFLGMMWTIVVVWNTVFMMFYGIL